jgi:hypothetical protein
MRAETSRQHAALIADKKSPSLRGTFSDVEC